VLGPGTWPARHDPATPPASSEAAKVPGPKEKLPPSFDATGAALFVDAARQDDGNLVPRARESHSLPIRIVTIEAEGAMNDPPRRSPDESMVAFDSNRDGDRGVYVARRDGTDLRRISGDGFAAIPSWSPDGSQLTFVRGEPNRPEVWNLWRCDLNTGE